MAVRLPHKKKNIKQLILSVVVAIVLVISDYWIQNLTYPLFDDVNLLTWVDKIVGTNKNFFDESDVTYVNLSKDKMLVPQTDEWGDTIGNDAITNRENLLQFLELASITNYKYIFLDVRFGHGDVTSFDSALFAKIKSMPNLVIATHRTSDDYAIADSSLLFKTAYADYRHAIHAGFSRYEFLQDGHRSVALQMFHDIDHHDIKKHWYGYTCDDGHLCYNSKYIPLSDNIFHFSPIETQDNTSVDAVRYYYLGADILNPRFFTEEEVITSLLNDKIIILGDFDNDIHDTYIGDIPGSIIPLVAYKYLKSDMHELSWIYVGFLFFLFFAITFVMLTIRNIAAIFVESSLWHYLLSLMGIAALFFIIKILFYIFFSISMIMIVPTIVYHIIGNLSTYRNLFKKIFFQRNKSQTPPKERLSFILLLFFSVLSILPTSAQTKDKDYKIERLIHAESTTINSIPARIGNFFSRNAIIQWGTNDAAAILVKEISSNKLYRLSKRQFNSKGNIKTLQDFFLRTSKTSTRGDVNEAVVTLKPCSNRFSYKEKRLALVVGNAAYTSLPTLQNPQSDAAAVSDKLISIGFDVIESYDCTVQEFRSLLTQFEQIVNREGYQIVLFYYAGHGIQKDGKNYLVPVNIPLQKPADINACIGCDDVLRSLEGTSSSSRIIIFDACRNFSSALSERNSNGLAQIQQLAPGTMLIYSTGFGKVANDGEGEHSPFAQALLSNIGKTNTSFELEIKDVARETYLLTAKQQYPAIAGSLTDNLVLNPGINTLPTSTTPNADEAEKLIDKGKKACKKFNYSEAYNYFLEAANMGNREGIYQLGMLYCNDNFDGANLDDAIKWLTRAANLGHADAMFNLGDIYLGRDNATAKKWFKQAADLKHEKAAAQLRKMKK